MYFAVRPWTAHYVGLCNEPLYMSQLLTVSQCNDMSVPVFLCANLLNDFYSQILDALLPLNEKNRNI